MTSPELARERYGGLRKTGLRLEHARSIQSVDPRDWDPYLADRGSFSWQGMRSLERIFDGNAEDENNWRFHYFIVREPGGRPKLVTYFCEAIWKDDMLAPAALSELVEERRVTDPSFLTSRVFAMGSLFSEGNHLYLDRSGDWREALTLLLAQVENSAQVCNASVTILRDLPADDPELDHALSKCGFERHDMPPSMCVELDWASEEEWIAGLTPKSRRHQRRWVVPWNAAYQVEILGRGGRQPNAAEFAHFHRLYRQVKARSLALNTYDLPESLFERMLESPNWELLALTLRPEFGGVPGARPQSVVACFVAPEQYVPMVIGMDYRFVVSHCLYRQSLRHAILRARRLGLKKVALGFGAPLEKRRFGARPRAGCLYAKGGNHEQAQMLAELEAQICGESNG